MAKLVNGIVITIGNVLQTPIVRCDRDGARMEPVPFQQRTSFKCSDVGCGRRFSQELGYFDQTMSGGIYECVQYRCLICGSPMRLTAAIDCDRWKCLDCGHSERRIS